MIIMTIMARIIRRGEVPSLNETHASGKTRIRHLAIYVNISHMMLVELELRRSRLCARLRIDELCIMIKKGQPVSKYCNLRETFTLLPVDSM